MSEKHAEGTIDVEARHDQRQDWFDLCLPVLNGQRQGIIADTFNADHIFTVEEHKANADRLAACWNACIGHDPAELRRKAEAYPKLVALLRDCIAATLRQLAGMGKGKEPSPSLQETIDAANALLASLETT